MPDEITSLIEKVTSAATRIYQELGAGYDESIYDGLIVNFPYPEKDEPDFKEIIF